MIKSEKMHTTLSTEKKENGWLNVVEHNNYNDFKDSLVALNLAPIRFYE